jgi:hypothetical protein
MWRANVGLVRLPYEGCPVYGLASDQVTPRSWEMLCNLFGINRLRMAHPACKSKGLWTSALARK